MDKNALLELLTYSLDNQLNEDEREQLDAALKQFSWLRREQKALLTIREKLRSFNIAEDAEFSNNVMQRLGDFAIKKHEASIINLFPKVAAACLILLFAALINIYFVEGNLNTDTIIGIEDVSPDEAQAYILYEEN